MAATLTLEPLRLPRHQRPVDRTGWTLGRAAGRAREILRESGVQGLFFASLAQIGYRRLLIMERLLAEPIPPLTATVAVQTGQLEAADEYRPLGAGIAPAEVEARLQAGGRCFVARHAGRLVSVTWAFADRGPAPYLDAEIAAGSDSVVLCYSFTAPELRGRGVSPAVATEMISFFRAEGYRRLISAILPENRASLQALQKMGFRRIAVARSMAIAGRRRRSIRALALPQGAVR